jgi:hypothetical protein
MVHATLLALAISAGDAAAAPVLVRTARVPSGGIQPQLVVDGSTLHLLYYRGEPLAGDLFYASSKDGGATWSAEMRVNHDDGDAVSIGNVRGGHLALGREGRLHAAWMGAARSKQRGPRNTTPMLYSRLADDGKSFEPERNLVRAHPGLDGGGSVAADAAGRVYVAWHAPREKDEDEMKRTIWVAASVDDGKTFAEERAAWSEPTGACACCGMRAGCRGEDLVLLYRAARQGVNRDVYALVSSDHGKSFRGLKLDEWRVPQCVMSTEALLPSGPAMLAAWEDEGDVAWSRVDLQRLVVSNEGRPPKAGAKVDRKHPALAVNGVGDVLLAWTEGMAWERGGCVAWQLYGADGRPVVGASGRKDGVPPWSLVAAASLNDGSFVILY